MKPQNFYKTKTPYAITINPIDQHQYFSSAQRMIQFRDFIYEQTMSWKWKYEMFIEISEPRNMKTHGYSGPRMHLHGFFVFRNTKELAMFLLHGYREITRYASIDIDTISDHPKWMEYCAKQKLFKRNRISSFMDDITGTL